MAKQIATDVSKYANSINVMWDSFLDKIMLLKYFEALRRCLKIYSVDNHVHGRVDNINSLLMQWKYTLRKEEKKKLAH